MHNSRRYKLLPAIRTPDVRMIPISESFRSFLQMHGYSQNYAIRGEARGISRSRVHFNDDSHGNCTGRSNVVHSFYVANVTPLVSYLISYAVSHGEFYPGAFMAGEIADSN